MVRSAKISQLLPLFSVSRAIGPRLQMTLCLLFQEKLSHSHHASPFFFLLIAIIFLTTFFQINFIHSPSTLRVMTW